MDLNELQYYDLSTNTFSQRLKKSKLIAGYTQKELSKATGLSISTINELEAGYRDTIRRNTLLKLLKVLDANILCDDYCKFILTQEIRIKKLIDAYTINKLSKLLCVHRSTIERWRDFKYQVNRDFFHKINQLIISDN